MTRISLWIPTNAGQARGPAISSIFSMAISDGGPWSATRESAFRDGEDDGIGAFHWFDEGFGHAWRHADRAPLFRAGGDRQPADRAGWRQSQASAGTS